MGEIRNRISEHKDWIAVDLNPESDILQSLAGNLYLIPSLKTLFMNAKLDFSMLGIGIQIEQPSMTASNGEDAVKMMLEVLKKAHKKILITIDEVTYNSDIAKFSHAMSSYANQNYEVYVLMTGLLDNIKAIKNKKSLTFLYRAKILELDSLNLTSISMDYRNTLDLDEDTANHLARESGGYSLAFQALGYHYWNEICRKGPGEKIDFYKIRGELDSSLSELSYEKIWDELSGTDKKVLVAMTHISRENESMAVKVDDIKKRIDMSSNTFSTYRKRLTENGILDGSQYGYLSFKLPGFDRFVYIQEG
ncbi:MAG: ATP-binding protein [Lachnospiraceae bacterium]|nr:ATP-binding protein [Lachnospiraceae bacterium]